MKVSDLNRKEGEGGRSVRRNGKEREQQRVRDG